MVSGAYRAPGRAYEEVFGFKARQQVLGDQGPEMAHPVLPSQGYEHDSRALAGLPDLSCRRLGFSVILMYRDWKCSYEHGLHVLAAYCDQHEPRCTLSWHGEWASMHG